MEVTKEQIAEWKAKHGEISKISVDGKSCYLKQPNRKDMGYAAMAGKENPIKFNEVILNACWLGGDEEIRTNDMLFMSASSQIASLIELKEATLEKL
jgi:hypothetical protein